MHLPSNHYFEDKVGPRLRSSFVIATSLPHHVRASVSPTPITVILNLSPRALPFLALSA